ncbi:MAG: DUF1521 domain-containing protein [Burkholderiaceae bacterium]
MLQWTVTDNHDGTGSIDLGPYTLSFNDRSQQWIITDKKTGKQTRVWGDPHVDYGNDGSNDLNFKEAINLGLGWITVHADTVPYGNGQKVTSRLTISDTQTGQAYEISGLDSADGKVTIKKIDLSVARARNATGTSVIQGDDGTWYTGLGQLRDGAIADNGSIDFSHVDMTKSPSGQMGPMLSFVWAADRVKVTDTTGRLGDNGEGKTASSSSGVPPAGAGGVPTGQAA